MVEENDRVGAEDFSIDANARHCASGGTRRCRRVSAPESRADDECASTPRAPPASLCGPQRLPLLVVRQLLQKLAASLGYPLHEERSGVIDWERAL